MSNLTVRSFFKYALFMVLVLGTAFVGVKLGMGSKLSSSNSPEHDPNVPQSKLNPGFIFPDVQLIDETGANIPSQSLIAGKGGVVMFMDLACPPCQEMTEKLQQAYATEMSDVTVVGITPEKPHDVLYYRKKNNLTFPIYSDTAFTFMSQYQVQNFPLFVIVGKSGQVREFTFDARLPIDADHIRELIEQ